MLRCPPRRKGAPQAVADSPVEKTSAVSRSLKIKNGFHTLHPEILSRLPQITLKVFADNRKIVARKLPEGSLHPLAELTGAAVGIFMIHQQIRHKTTPEVSLKPMALRELRKLAKAVVKRFRKFLFFVLFIPVMLQNPCGITKQPVLLTRSVHPVQD